MVNSGDGCEGGAFALDVVATGVGEVGGGVVSFGGALGGAGDLDGVRTPRKNRFLRPPSLATTKGGSRDEEVEGSEGGGFGRATGASQAAVAGSGAAAVA